MSPWMLISVGLAEAVAASGTPRPTPTVAHSASHKAGAFVQLESGISLCGTRGAADCRETGPGFALGGRLGWQALPWVAVDLDFAMSGLPVSGLPPGRLLFVGPGVHGALPFRAWTLTGGAAIGYSRVSADAASVGGFGALRFDATLTYTLAERFPVGLGYAHVRPRGDEVCAGGRCANTEVAALHQFLVVGGARF